MKTLLVAVLIWGLAGQAFAFGSHGGSSGGGWSGPVIHDGGGKRGSDDGDRRVGDSHSGSDTTLGRMTFGEWVALIAAHDDNHLNQAKRALEGRG